MAKLSPEMLDEGRACVRTQDVESLIDWIKRSDVIIDLKAARKAFTRCFRAGDTSKALRMFDAVFADADPTVDKVVLGIKVLVLGVKLAFVLFVIFGLLGGVAYLFGGH